MGDLEFSEEFEAALREILSEVEVDEDGRIFYRGCAMFS